MIISQKFLHTQHMHQDFSDMHGCLITSSLQKTSCGIHDEGFKYTANTLYRLTMLDFLGITVACISSRKVERWMVFH